jgi:hypothetical protein
MSIKNDVDELSKIQNEIKENNFKNKILRKRCQVLEDNIAEYLKSKEQTGIKYNGQAIIIENKQKKLIKSHKAKQEDVKLLFQTLGVTDPQKAYDQLQEIQKGISIPHQKLTIKPIPT